eukprot:Gb_36512 [translate_table: standard]
MILQTQNYIFKSDVQHDTHEFFNFLLNKVAYILEKEVKKSSPNEGYINIYEGIEGCVVTWVHKIFEDNLIKKMRCFGYDTVTTQDEAFFDFSSTKTLNGDDKLLYETYYNL